MKSESFSIDTSRDRFLDLTELVSGFVAGKGDGLVHVFAPHATAGIALIETGSGTEQDLESTLERLLPRDDRYVHRHGSVGHGADHVIPAFISPSVVIPVVDGGMALGTWQRVVFVDMNRDNPARQVRLSFLAAPE